MTKLERVRWQDLAVVGASGGGGVVLISAGDVEASGAAALAFAQAGADIILLHRPADEATVLATALRVEAAGRRCELFAGDLDDAETCQEAAIHAAFFGRGGIGALVYVESPVEGGMGLPDRDTPAAQEALRQSVLGLWSLTRAALPHMAAGARIVHLQLDLPADAGPAALAARRTMQGFARGLLATLRRDHGIRGHSLCGPAAARHVALVPAA